MPEGRKDGYGTLRGTMDNGGVIGRRRRAVLGGLLTGVGLVLGVGGTVSALIDTFNIPTLFEPYPIGEDLIAAVIGALVFGLGIGLMVASTIR